MPLVDLIYKYRTTRPAIDIHAIPAGPSRQGRTDLLKHSSTAIYAIPAGPEKPEAAKLIELLRQFRFDLVEQDIKEGYPTAELDRVNNLAWEFMQADGMEFSAALRQAAQITIESRITASEAAYEDARALWRRLTLNAS